MDFLTMNVEIYTVLTRLSVAALLGMTIGWEREMKNKPAGLRTHMLVAIGAAAFFLITIELALGPLKDAENLSLDPTRIFQGVITGIGFLGAGAIIQGREEVRGLTTGAGIWVAGAIGLACGGGYYVIAGVLAAFAIIILAGLRAAEKKFSRNDTDTKNDNPA